MVVYRLHPQAQQTTSRLVPFSKARVVLHLPRERTGQVSYLVLQRGDAALQFFALCLLHASPGSSRRIIQRMCGSL